MMLSHTLNVSKSICGNTVSADIHYHINQVPVIKFVRITISSRGELFAVYDELPDRNPLYLKEFHDKLFTHAANEIEELKRVEIEIHQAWVKEDKQLMEQSL
jgi:hypothetical protein